MKKIIRTSLVALILSATLINCKKSDSTELITKQQPPSTLNKEKLELAKSFEESKASKSSAFANSASIESTVSYTSLCSGVTVSGTAQPRCLYNPAGWNYYSFNGKAGDIVNISVRRTGNCKMDPSFSLFFGTTNDNSDVTYYNGGANMTYVINRDDEVPPVCANSCYGDPELTNFVLPSTGTYTLAVYDYVSCGEGPLTYDVTVKGTASCTVKIGDCDTGVPNIVLANGNTISQEIEASKKVSKNHGQFVSGVAHLTNDLRKKGLITEAQKEQIMNCASSSK